MLKTSQLALIKACKKLGIKYEILHKDKIIVKVHLNPPLFFIHHYKAFDREDISKICKDKDITYTLLEGKINIPKWKAYLDPNCPEQYKNYIHYKTREEIVEDISHSFSLPLVIKMNRGSQGKNVYACNSVKDIREAIVRIYDRSSVNYDFILIAQEYVKIFKEYRVNVYKKKILFAYEKNIDSARYTGNISPLHWENSKAVLIRDENLLNRIDAFIQPIFNEIPVNFAGIDIALLENGEFILIEINKSPGIARFVKDNGMDEVVKMYEVILGDLRDPTVG